MGGANSRFHSDEAMGSIMQQQRDAGGLIEIHSLQTCRQLQLTGTCEESESGMILRSFRKSNCGYRNSRSRCLPPALSQRKGATGPIVSRESCRLSRTLSEATERAMSRSSAAQVANGQSWLSRKSRRAVVVGVRVNKKLVEKQFTGFELNATHILFIYTPAFFNKAISVYTGTA